MSFAPIEHTYSHLEVRLHPYLCLHEVGVPKPIACQEVLQALGLGALAGARGAKKDDVHRPIL